jgi:hypothetical protein
MQRRNRGLTSYVRNRPLLPHGCARRNAGVHFGEENCWLEGPVKVEMLLDDSNLIQRHVDEGLTVGLKHVLFGPGMKNADRQR